MAVHKINLMAILLVFTNVFLTSVSANVNPHALQECFQAMENFCRVRNPSALDCARAAVKFWTTELPQIDMQEYYEALYKNLSMNPFETAIDFCHGKRSNFRQQCRDELKDYIPVARRLFSKKVAMESLCGVEDPKALDCAQAAILSWSTPLLDFEDLQEYYEALFDNLFIGDVQTPSEFCHNKKLQSKRLQCKTELKVYFTPKRSGKEDSQMHAVHHAFFNAVFSCECKGNKLLATSSHKKFNHSYKDRYILSIRDKIQVKDDMNSPEEYCLEKYVPGYKNQI